MSRVERPLGRIIEDCFQNPTDPEILKEFDAAFRPHMLAILVSFYRRDPSLAEDAYQNAFIKFLRIFKKPIDVRKNYEAYFVAVAKNALLDEIRRQRPFVSFDDGFDKEFVRTGVDKLDETEARILVLEAMMKLEKRCRFMLEAHFIYGMSNVEIAQYLDIQVNSLPMTIMRCKDKLKKNLLMVL